MPKKDGFTLIELLVVISIIAILSTIGLAYYGTFLKNSRDVRRQSDLKVIQSALEEYHADQFYYPFSVTADTPLTFAGKTYLTRVPNDPIGNPPYSYIPQGTGCLALSLKNCTSYCLYAGFEGTPPNDSACTPPGGYNYGVTRP